ncbi:MAG: hypothetical protein H6747_01590 [Deltaproteobacteria bacterium]|nr:hypothetical protein [Deltaproteobacteria bacterium]
MIGDLAQIAATLRQAGLDVVFIGGIVIPLYLGPEGRARARATEDIDLVVAAHTFAAWTRTEVTLRRLGFTNDVRDDAPICRFLFEGLTLDVIPVAPQFLGMDAAHLQAVMDRAQMYRDRRQLFLPVRDNYFCRSNAPRFSPLSNGRHRWASTC